MVLPSFFLPNPLLKRAAPWTLTLLLGAVSLPAVAQSPVYTGPCTRRTSIVLSEIMYAPEVAPGGQNLEFIELYNSSPISEDLSGWQLRGETDFTFPAGTRLAGGQFLIIAADPAALQATGVTGTVLGPWTGTLPNGTGTVRFRKASGGIVLETNYQDDPPWPLAADGAGHSLVLAQPSFGESQATAWSASAQPGGSPNAVDPRTLSPEPTTTLDRVIFSEILAASATAGGNFIELFNPGPGAADLSGCRLSPGRALPGYTLPAGTSLAAGARLTLTEGTLGFSPAASGGDLFLRASDGLKVLQAIRYAGQDVDKSHGPAPLLSGPWRELSSPTPGAVNAAPLVRPVVINEIHYHPAGNDDGAEFIELHNQSTTPIDVSGWELSGGIRYVFPAGTSISANGYLVIARDRTRLLSLQPAAPAALVLGNFSGNLANSGERIALTFPRTSLGPAGLTWQVTADEVSYADGGRWPKKADGGGTSLQLIDPRADNSLAPSWRPADESAKATTITMEHTGVLDLGHPGVTSATRVAFMLMGAGEFLVDDVEVLVAGANRVSNSNFSTGIAGWNRFGTHRPTVPENGAMRLSATDTGDLANLVETTLTSAIPANTTVTLRAKVRWISGNPELTMTLNGGLLEAAATLPVPANVGTPGLPNAGMGNAGPAITNVTHFPVVPAAGQSIRVTAQVQDPDQLAAVRLRYRLDPATSLTQINMSDDGSTQGDALAGDGIYSAQIPAQSNGAMIAFHVTAVDAASTGVISLFPHDAPARECHIKVGEPTPAGAFSTMRMWLTQASHNSWRDRERSSNLDIDATFVSDGRVIYNAGVSYAGSQNGVTIYNSPTGDPAGYNISLPDDEVFLNVQKLTLDRETTRDVTRQRERLMHWFLEKLELPNLHRRYVHVYLNGVKRNQLIMEDVQKPNDDVMAEWFEDEGRLTKTNPWFEFTPDGTVQTGSSVANRIQHFRTTGGALKLPRYRRTWSQAAGHDSAHDFSGISALITAGEATDTQLSATMNPVADLRQWMRTFAMNDLASFWDTFGNPGSKNAYLFESLVSGRWSVVTWDMDVGLGVFNDPVNAELFPAGVDPVITRLYNRPDVVRHYWQALDESLSGFFTSTANSDVQRILNETWQALTANGAAVTSPFVPSGAYSLSVTDWIAQRRTFLQGQLSGKNPAFSAVTAASTSLALATINGTGPLAIDSITVNGLPLAVTWTGISQWTAKAALQPGANSLLVEARNRAGTVLGSTTLTVQYTGQPQWPALRFTEVMAGNPASTGFTDPADGKSDDWLELHNPSAAPISLEGWYLSDQPDNPQLFRIPAGFTIPAFGYRLVWADEETFQNAPQVRPDLHAGFKISASGETLLLTAPDGLEIDRLVMGPQTSGVALLRAADGSSLGYSNTGSPGAANTIPTSGTLPEVLAATISDGQILLQFTSRTGGLYQVETSPDLSTWQPNGPPLQGTGNPMQTQVPGPVTGRGFVRLRNF